MQRCRESQTFRFTLIHIRQTRQGVSASGARMVASSMDDYDVDSQAGHDGYGIYIGGSRQVAIAAGRKREWWLLQMRRMALCRVHSRGGAR